MATALDNLYNRKRQRVLSNASSSSNNHSTNNSNSNLIFNTNTTDTNTTNSNNNNNTSNSNSNHVNSITNSSSNHNNNNDIFNDTLTKHHFIPKKQHFNTEIINLDSDDDDYVFNNNNKNKESYNLMSYDEENFNNSYINQHGDNDVFLFNEKYYHNNDEVDPIEILDDDFEFYNSNNSTNHMDHDNNMNDVNDGDNDDDDEDDDDADDDDDGDNDNNNNNIAVDDNDSDNIDYMDEENVFSDIYSESYHPNESIINKPTIEVMDLSDDQNLNLYSKSNEYTKTRHQSFASPFNNFLNKFLKKKKSTDSHQSLDKKRTKSMPQLSYSKLTYSPCLDLNEINLKIGDVKASYVNHDNSNYTYLKSDNKDLDNKLDMRKLSFNRQKKFNKIKSFSSTSVSNTSSSNIELNDNNEIKNKINSSSNRSRKRTNHSNSASSFDESIKLNKHQHFQIQNLIKEEMKYDTDENSDGSCDDDDGYYIIKNNAPFVNGRFIIKKLLGQGTFGKVVKAYDNKTHEYVAIKIIKSIHKYREASKIELRVLTMLKKHDPDNKYQLIHLRECFDYRNHICIVTNLLKISLYDFMEKNQFLPFPGSHIQAISKQLLRSVAFLHDLKLIHTDLKPENILITDDSYYKKSYTKISNNEKFNRKILKDPKICTIDFGSAIFEDEYHSSVVSTRHYRAPEIILGIGWSFPCDIWSVGSILIELLTGDALFKTHKNDQHLAMMEKAVGKPIDFNMVYKCFQLYSNVKPNLNSRFDYTVVNNFSNLNGKLLFMNNCNDNKLIREVNQVLPIEKIVEEKIGFKFNLSMNCNDSIKYFNINSKNVHEYKFWYYYIDLIKKMLVFDPDERITAKNALHHEWFDLGILDDGIR